ncbi:hypothetical protein [Vibrio metschnikovii]|uniref:hypothetical protein n=1 Tax=Vibrio metschnikovii TaxID=28172 RepID=UPI001C306EC9|nr:hypothetical protein [Vibrio metschnikovii]
MKNLTIVLLTSALVIPLNVSANKIKSEQCPVIYNAGLAIMEWRQNGVTIVEAMESLEDLNKGNNTSPEHMLIYKIFKSLIIDAYRLPTFTSEANKEKAIEDFANNVANSCYSAAK